VTGRAAELLEVEKATIKASLHPLKKWIGFKRAINHKIPQKQGKKEGDQLQDPVFRPPVRGDRVNYLANQFFHSCG